MKSSRLIVLGILGLVLVVGLTGCKITGATPDPSVPLVMRIGDSQTFKVDGPAEIKKTGSYYLIYYVWTLNDKYIEATGGGGKQLDFVADPQKFHIANRMQVKCQLIQMGLQYYCDEQQGGCGWWAVWTPVDKRVWNISLVQDPPVWQFDCIIKDNADIQSLKAFTAITGSLTISNSNLSNLTGLENITSIGGDLRIFENSTLKNLTGLENLTSVGGDLEIFDNDALTSLTGLDNLTSVGGYLLIRENTVLTNLSGLENITSVGGSLYISDNGALTSLTGLDNLTSVGGYLNIYNNAVLTSLSGLQNLTSVGGYLYISSNDALTSLEMTGLQRVNGDFDITSNPLLCKSLVEELRDQVLAAGGIGGTKYIENNKICTTP